MSHNKLCSIEDIQHLTKCHTISVLDLSYNVLEDPGVLDVFAAMTSLRVLNMIGNPVLKHMKNYRKHFIFGIRDLCYLDDRPVSDKERACVNAWSKGGVEGERKERIRWKEMEQEKIRRSVEAVLALRKGKSFVDILSINKNLEEKSENQNTKKVSEVKPMEIQLTHIKEELSQNKNTQLIQEENEIFHEEIPHLIQESQVVLDEGINNEVLPESKSIDIQEASKESSQLIELSASPIRPTNIEYSSGENEERQENNPITQSKIYENSVPLYIDNKHNTDEKSDAKSHIYNHQNCITNREKELCQGKNISFSKSDKNKIISFSQKLEKNIIELLEVYENTSHKEETEYINQSTNTTKHTSPHVTDSDNSIPIVLAEFSKTVRVQSNENETVENESIENIIPYSEAICSQNPVSDLIEIQDKVSSVYNFTSLETCEVLNNTGTTTEKADSNSKQNAHVQNDPLTELNYSTKTAENKAHLLQFKDLNSPVTKLDVEQLFRVTNVQSFSSKLVADPAFLPNALEDTIEEICEKPVKISKIPCINEEECVLLQKPKVNLKHAEDISDHEVKVIIESPTHNGESNKSTQEIVAYLAEDNKNNKMDTEMSREFNQTMLTEMPAEDLQYKQKAENSNIPATSEGKCIHLTSSGKKRELNCENVSEIIIESSKQNELNCATASEVNNKSCKENVSQHHTHLKWIVDREEENTSNRKVTNIYFERNVLAATIVSNSEADADETKSVLRTLTQANTPHSELNKKEGTNAINGKEKSVYFQENVFATTVVSECETDAHKTESTQHTLVQTTAKHPKLDAEKENEITEARIIKMHSEIMETNANIKPVELIIMKDPVGQFQVADEVDLLQLQEELLSDTNLRDTNTCEIHMNALQAEEICSLHINDQNENIEKCSNKDIKNKNKIFQRTNSNLDNCNTGYKTRRDIYESQTSDVDSKSLITEQNSLVNRVNNNDVTDTGINPAINFSYNFDDQVRYITQGSIFRETPLGRKNIEANEKNTTTFSSQNYNTFTETENNQECNCGETVNNNSSGLNESISEDKFYNKDQEEAPYYGGTIGIISDSNFEVIPIANRSYDTEGDLTDMSDILQISTPLIQEFKADGKNTFMEISSEEEVCNSSNQGNDNGSQIVFQNTHEVHGDVQECDQIGKSSDEMDNADYHPLESIKIRKESDSFRSIFANKPTDSYSNNNFPRICKLGLVGSDISEDEELDIQMERTSETPYQTKTSLWKIKHYKNDREKRLDEDCPLLFQRRTVTKSPDLTSQSEKLLIEEIE
ncbi:uncharacterized protein LOC118200384 isoform X2 [Stegodyphus dumicola]|nr:uncharacterized protein LOC118200384 isoform X2 [Stegodyphus dumicola]